MAEKPRLVVVGSGWAGYYLAEKIDLNAYSVTILSPRRTTTYTPLLASAAVGLFGFSLAEDSVRSKARSQLRFIKSTVLDIDFDRKVCKCKPAFKDNTKFAEFEIEYDFLVLTQGCMPNTFGTPGVEEHAIFMRHVTDAMTLRKKLFDLLEMASLPNMDPDEIRGLLHIAIVGGGPTGIELTAELHDLLHGELLGLYPSVAPLAEISIYDIAPNILSSFDKQLHEYASKQLESRNVNIETDTQIERVDNEHIYIKDKPPTPYGILIWATGNKESPLTATLSERVRFPEKGMKRILTDTRLRVLKPEANSGVYDSIFAIGDAADIDTSPLPTTAEVAVQKAKYIVRHFNSLQQQTQPQQPFKYTQKQSVSYIGSQDGVIAGKSPNSPDWTGSSAWVSWRTGSLMWNRNWRSRVAMVLTWALNGVFGVDVAKL